MNIVTKAVILFSVLLVSGIATPDDWEFDIVPTTTTVSQSACVKNQYYVVMFSADYCTHCKIGKDYDIPVLKTTMPRTMIVDVQQDTQWKKPKNIRFKSGVRKHSGIKSLPTFWLVEVGSSGKESVVEEWVGKTSHTTITSKLRTVTDSVTAKSTVDVEVLVESPANSNIYNGRSNSSHKNRNSLINHLMREGNHAGKHNLNNLNNMSDESLDRLHDRDHN